MIVLDILTAQVVDMKPFLTVIIQITSLMAVYIMFIMVTVMIMGQ
jgi:hypothetical protein